MYFNVINISISVIICANYVVSEEKPVVETTHGTILGKVLKTLIKNVDYFGFMGIPYAAPPIGDLRFLVSKKYFW